MSKINFVPELFIGSEELNKFQDFIDTEGFRKNIKDNSVQFGLVYSNLDPNFDNGKITQDLDLDGDKTFKWNEIKAIDSDGNFIYKQTGGQFIVPNDATWYWVKIRHNYTTVEKGIFSISDSGLVTATGANDLTELLRGQPNFPSKITFPNASLNTQEYEVLEVLNSNSFQLIGASFQNETNLNMVVVGTFTNKVTIPTENKYPFQYDSCTLSLVQEEVGNEYNPPIIGFIQDKDFYLARLRRNGSDLIIQDKRTQVWKSIGVDKLENDFDNVGENEIVGVEGVRWALDNTSKEKSSVKIGWGIRTQDFSVNTTLNYLTLNTIQESGKLKTSSAFVNNSVNGWRLYTQNGVWRKIIASTKIGSAIRLTLDVLDIADYSDDGGNTINEQEIRVVPNAEQIIIQCIPNEFTEQDKYDLISANISFPIEKAWADIELVNYGYTYGIEDDISSYKIFYQYKNFKNYSPVTQIPEDSTNGYYIETSYDVNGNLKTSGTTRRTYVDPERSILLLPPVNSFDSRLRGLETGDKFGFEINTITPTSSFILTVGLNAVNQYFTGDATISNDRDIMLDTTGAKNGNYFNIYIRGKINLNNFLFKITQGVVGESTSTPITLKYLTQMDVDLMDSISGLVLRCVYSEAREQWFLTGYQERLSGFRGTPDDFNFGLSVKTQASTLLDTTTSHADPNNSDNLLQF